VIHRDVSTKSFERTSRRTNCRRASSVTNTMRSLAFTFVSELSSAPEPKGDSVERRSELVEETHSLPRILESGNREKTEKVCFHWVRSPFIVMI